MNFKDIKDLTVEELKKKERLARQELFEMRMKHSMGQVSNPMEIRGVRRDIARLNTAISAKLR